MLASDKNYRDTCCADSYLKFIVKTRKPVQRNRHGRAHLKISFVTGLTRAWPDGNHTSAHKNMARSPKHIANRNAAAKKSDHLNQHANLKRRFMQRIASGKTTQIGKASLDKFGMTIEEVNDIRRCDGFGDLRRPLEPTLPFRLPDGDNGGDAAPASNPAPAPNSRSARSSRKRARKQATLPPRSDQGSHDNEVGRNGHASSQAQDAPDVTVEYVLNRIWDAVGAQQLDKNLQLQFVKGQPLTLARGTVKSYHDKVRQLYKDMGSCTKGAASCFKDARKFFRHILSTYQKYYFTKSYVGAVYGIRPYTFRSSGRRWARRSRSSTLRWPTPTSTQSRAPAPPA